MIPRSHGLARYVETHATACCYIEAAEAVNSELWVLDLTCGDVQVAIDLVRGGDATAQNLFSGYIVSDYV